jgi:hypothetical protein
MKEHHDSPDCVRLPPSRRFRHGRSFRRQHLDLLPAVEFTPAWSSIEGRSRAHLAPGDAVPRRT